MKNVHDIETSYSTTSIIKKEKSQYKLDSRNGNKLRKLNKRPHHPQHYESCVLIIVMELRANVIFN